LIGRPARPVLQRLALAATPADIAMQSSRALSPAGAEQGARTSAAERYSRCRRRQEPTPAGERLPVSALSRPPAVHSG
jgi:hypothetical protein